MVVLGDLPPASIPNLKQFSTTFLASTIPPACASHLKIKPGVHVLLAHSSIKLELSNGPSISVSTAALIKAFLRPDEVKVGSFKEKEFDEAFDGASVK